MVRRLGVTAALLLLATLTVGFPALAQGAGELTVNFVVTPSRVELRAEPGDVIEFSVEVFNRGEAPLQLLTSVEDIEVSQNELIEGRDLAFTASRWSHFNADVIEVPAEGSTEARVRVAIPPDTPTGGYHAFAFFRSAPVQTDAGLLPSARIGVTVLLDVAPAGEVVERSASVSQTALDVSWTGLFTPVVTGRATIDNIGDAHVMAGGLHTYRTFPGSAVEELEVGPRMILRGTRHTFESTFDRVPLIGKVTVTSELVYQVGPNELPVILTQVTTWIIPWRLFILALLVAVQVIAGVRGSRRQKPQSTTDDEPVKESGRPKEMDKQCQEEEQESEPAHS